MLWRKKEHGLDVLIMGDLNAHFNDEGETLDCRAKFGQRLCEVVGLGTMNFEAIPKGKWTWQDGKKKSALYVLASQGIADSVTQKIVDNDGWFDIDSDH